MIQLADWNEIDHGNVGTPGWWTLNVTLRGMTRTTNRKVFAAVEDPPVGDECRILVAAEYGEVEAEVLTPFEVRVRLTREGVRRYRICGATKEEQVLVATP